MKKKQSYWLAVPIALVMHLGVMPQSVQAQGRFSTATDPEQVPTARYGRGEAVDLALIIDEWRDRYPAIPVFVCSCNADTCGNPAIWPFRAYSRYQPFVALGKANAANNETAGFNCFEMATGARPQ
jgi:hypothetical protein